MTLLMIIITLAWHMFFSVCLHSRSFLLCANWQKSDSSVKVEPQGNYRWNSNSKAPQRACSQANLTWAKHRQITWKTLTFSCKSSHGISHSQLIQDLRCKPAVLKRRHGAPAFQTIFNKVFGLVLNQHQFRSHWRDLTSRTCFLRPKTFYCQNKAHNILSFCLNPGSVFHPCSQMRQNTSR